MATILNVVMKLRGLAVGKMLEVVESELWMLLDDDSCQ
jgi:hypothetical protein